MASRLSCGRLIAMSGREVDANETGNCDLPVADTDWGSCWLLALHYIFWNRLNVSADCDVSGRLTCSMLCFGLGTNAVVRRITLTITPNALLKMLLIPS